MSVQGDAAPQALRRAEDKGLALLAAIEARGVVRPGLTEEALSVEIHALAEELFGGQRYWHKRVIRAGENTLCPYREWPPNREIGDDDILFLDLGPVFDDWEADVGRTYVLGDDPRKHALKRDVEIAWREGHELFHRKRGELTGSELFQLTVDLAHKMGWALGGPHAGHLIGAFPYAPLQADKTINYIRPENDKPMCTPDANGNRRQWIYEIHFIDPERRIGGFFEQWLGDYAA
jgi:Xaa-Pro dipeptidase